MSVAVLLALVLQLPEYQQQLVAIDAQLERGETARAAKAAAELLDAKVMADGRELSADRWALAPLARGEPHRARLRAVIAALGEAPSVAPPPRPDLLAELRAEQQIRAPDKGGELTVPELPQRAFRERLIDWLVTALSWIGDRIADLFRWILGSDAPVSGREQAAGRRVVGLLAGAVAVILVAVIALAVSSLRGRRMPGPAEPQEKRVLDEDPLSRTVSGWEARARELAAMGRAREAIRAWYHAVLVRSYGMGLLHYRRDRTNWEYARALPPQISWRGRFEELTRQFDVEWYGRDQSSAEALETFAAGAGEILRALGQAR